MKLQIKKIKYFSIILFLVFTLTFLSSMPAISKKELESLPDEGSSEYYKGYIKPGIQGSESNADILTQWNNADGTPHWSKIDEATGDMNGDGGNIRDYVLGECDKWRFTSLSLAPNEYVTKLVYWAYIKEQAATTSTYVDIDSSASTSGSWSATGTSYQWKSYTKSGLWLSKSALDGFWLQAKVADMPSWMEGYNPGWIDIETVFVDVYVETGPSPPSSPTLYDISSPNDNGIITLDWTLSSGAISYKVYKSDAEFGTYTLIATTSSLSYTDTVTSGSYWYYVRAHNNDGDSVPSNREGVEVYLYQDTWYESNEEYNIGDFPANEWDPWSSGDEDMIDILWASDYNVDMWGKMIRIYSPNLYHPSGIERFETFTIAPGESLYLKFKAQMNKEYATGEGIIELIANSLSNFLKISFNSQYERIDIWTVDGQLMQYWDQVLGRVIDFDIVVLKDPDTNNLKYLIFIDQKLEFVHEASTDLYPISSCIRLGMDQVDSGEFFIDNFFLGMVGNSITSEEPAECAYPMYYLYIPEWLSGTDHVDSMSIKYYYEHIYEQTLSFSLSIGFEVGIGFDTEVPIGDVIQLEGDEPKYIEISTTGEDVIVYYWIIGLSSNITVYLPGIDPDSGASEIKGMYEYTFQEEHVTSASISAFEQHFGALPEEYTSCSRSGNAQISDYRTIQASCEGDQLKWYNIDDVELDYSWTFDWGISAHIPLKGLEFDFGISFVIECTNVYRARVSLGVDWDGGQAYDDKIQLDLYAPPEGTYSTALDMAPISIQQVPFHEPTNPTGLSATPGQNRVDLSWNANPESDIDHYNIYRNTAKVGESTTTSYADTGLADSTTYTYQVAAVNIYGEDGPRSNSVQATTNPEVIPATPGIYLIMIASFGIVVLLINRKTKKRKIDR